MADFAREIRRKNNGSDYTGGRDGTSVWIRKGCGFLAIKNTSSAWSSCSANRHEDEIVCRMKDIYFAESYVRNFKTLHNLRNNLK